MRDRRRRLRRVLRAVVIVVIVAVAVVAARPLLHLARAAWSDRDTRPPLAAGMVDDASHLNATAVREVITVGGSALEAERRVVALLERAVREHLPVSIAGARHTMGGHTIAPDGLVLDMNDLDHMSLDDAGTVLTAGSGARWDAIIPFLDTGGRSVAIMQSNSSFTVGGSISANCHGWQHGRPPIASSVRSFRLVRPDGTVVRCSRTEHPELFGLVLGGYGLFGVILEVDLDVVPNERYTLDRMIIDADDFVRRFEEETTDRDDTALVYGRFCIVPDRLLDEVILNVFRRSPCAPGEIPPLGATTLAGVKRTIFRGSVESDYGKALRWDAECRLSQHLAQPFFGRNQLLSEGVEIYENRSAESTDILHEYFVPPAALGAFLADVRALIPAHGADLLNVTIRHVRTDEDTVLRYADAEMLALVMLFNQRTGAAAERDMQTLTRALIDAALDRGGRYYLPYRLHATPEQFRRAYPQADAFFARKREHDPAERFRNMFYDRYAHAKGAAPGGAAP